MPKFEPKDFYKLATFKLIWMISEVVEQTFSKALKQC